MSKTEEVQSKHGARVDLYLGIEFEGLGRHDIYTDIDKYITSKVGDNVCVEVRPRQVGLSENMVWDVFRATLACVSALATIGLIGYLISIGVFALNKIIDNE